MAIWVPARDLGPFLQAFESVILKLMVDEQPCKPASGVVPALGRAPLSLVSSRRRRHLFDAVIRTSKILLDFVGVRGIDGNSLEFTGIHWNSLELTGVWNFGIHWNLLELTGIYWNLLELTGA